MTLAAVSARSALQEVPFVLDYTPHSDPQRFFHYYCQRPESRVITLLAGIRFGKTKAGRAQLLRWILEQTPRRTAEGKVEAAPLSWIVGPDYRTANKAYREFRDLAGSLVQSVTKNGGAYELKLTMPRGLLGHTREEFYTVQVRTGQNKDSFVAEDVAYVWMDEGALCDKDVYLRCLGRVMNTGGKLIITSTPKPIDERTAVQPWIKTDVVDCSGEDGIYVVYARTEDRPYFHTPAGREELERLRRRLGPARARMELDGRFIALTCLLIPEFDYSTHVIDPFELPLGAEVFAGIDFGIAVPSAVVYYAVLGEQVVGVDEIVLINKGPEELCAAIKAHPLHARCVAYYADWAGAAERDVLYRRGVETIPGHKDLAQTYGLYRDMMQRKTSDGRSKLAWMRNCSNTIREMSNTRVPRSGLSRVRNNHCIDATRYALYTHLVGKPTMVGRSRSATDLFRGVPRHLLPPSIEKKLYGYISPDVVYLESVETDKEGYNPTYGNYREGLYSQARSAGADDEDLLLPDGSQD